MVRKNDFPNIKWVINEWGEFPSFYSDNACRIISDKYFSDGETSLWDMVYRVVHAIGEAGYAKRYFQDKGHQRTFQLSLVDLLLMQKASFNSPVWFNVGVEEEPQCSACFIQSVEDNMDSILQLMVNEGKLFKYGSGTGTNLSPLRPKNAPLSNGGKSSGPVEFMKMYDAGAGVIKSGGKTRRAAKMVLMDCDHPDVMEFVQCKAKEEKKVKRLVEMGVPVEEAYEGAMFQNGNNSVRLTDDFMQRATDSEVIENEQGELLHQIAQAAWECGDPGVQFSDTIQRAMPGDLVCNASNPCSEYLFIDESACNLASINVGKVWDAEKLEGATDTLITAMDIIVSMSSYPTEKIAENSEKYRPLGLGITNLAALLMRHGVEYDSDEGRDWAEDIMNVIFEQAKDTSSWLADKLGSNWDSNLRNAQLTLVAPTGTISFMMDCDSTGIEPVFAAEQTKHLVGGGTINIIPECVRIARENGHEEAVQTAMPGEDCTVVSTDGHLKMMEVIQPYLSGAISKTVNLPSYATVEDVKEVYIKAWKMGLKCIAVYRDGCKAHQPLEVTPTHEDHLKADKYIAQAGPPDFFGKPVADMLEPMRRVRLPNTRDSITHKFTVGGTSGYFTVGLYDEGSPGEIFVNISKEGSTIGGLMDAWATSISLGLQYGVPLEKFVRKFKGSRFEPAGFSNGGPIKSATSILDYIAQWLEQRFLSPVPYEDIEEEVGTAPVEEVGGGAQQYVADTGQLCPECGGPTQTTGTCQTCAYCGWNGGCG